MAAFEPSPLLVRRRSLVRRPGILLAAVALGAGLGLAVDVIRVGGVDAWLAARAPGPVVEPPPYDARGRLVEVDGRSVYLDCRGPDTSPPPGQATVVLEAGFGADAGSWGHVLDAVAEFARVCAWDRPGLGRSEARGRHTPAEALDDLWRALEASGEAGPVLVAGHSFGGVYGRILAGIRPAEVVGLLMIDAYYPDVGIEADPNLPADFRDRFRRSLEETAAMLAAGEDLDWARTLEQLREASPFRGPAIVLSIEPRLRPFDPDPAVNGVIVEAFEASIRRLFPSGRIEIVPNAGHFIHFDRPELVVARIRELLAAAAPQRSP